MVDKVKSTVQKLSWQQLVIILAAYLAIVIFVPQLTAQSDVGYGEFPTIEDTIRSYTIPVGLSALFIGLVITKLGWWKKVLIEKKPVRKWVWLFPIATIITAAAVTNYGNLSDVGLNFVLVMILTSLLVGTAEEFMFRGVVLQTMRDKYTERKAAILTAVLFGAAHSINLIGSVNPTQIAQVLVAGLAGYYFYLARRASGAIILPIFVHAFWDFSLFSSQTGDYEGTYTLTSLALLTSIILFFVLLAGHKHIEIDK